MKPEYKLSEEIIKLSQSDNWDSAKLEWSFELAYQNPNLQTCLCGHYPIKNICVIKNIHNSHVTEVGNCCIVKFLGIDRGTKIFDSIKRLKDDITKSLSDEVIEFIFEKKIITTFEYDFYKDTIRKRSLTPKQLNIRTRINQKFLAVTSIESNTTISRIEQVLQWAANNPWFNTDFVHSLKQTCETKGKLSSAQLHAFENIVSKLKINV